MKIPKSLKRMNKDTRRVLEWVASEYNYLKEVHKDLTQLNEDLGGSDIKKDEKDIRRAIKDLRYAGRSERRVDQYEQDMEEEINNLMNILPKNLKEEITNIEKHLHVAVAFLLSNASIFEGHIKQQIEQLQVNIQLLEKEEKHNPVQLDRVRNLKAIIAAETKKLIERVELTIKWVASLSTDVKNVEAWKDKLMKMAA